MNLIQAERLYYSDSDCILNRKEQEHYDDEKFQAYLKAMRNKLAVNLNNAAVEYNLKESLLCNDKRLRS